MCAAMQKLRAVAPFRVSGVNEGDPLRIAGIPGIFGRLDLLPCGFFRERWEWGSPFDLNFHVLLSFKSPMCV